ncbi:MAG: glycosyltransferase family 4 protein [Bacteroidales bacterium]|jgi:glycosyltransferase involved in cell wall biosynthesis|nr:glycosyltransferase family 4 protein [Bacteroidales bacterium]
MPTVPNVLFIRYKKPFGIKEGGEQGTHKNYSIFCDLFGHDHVEEYYVHPNFEQETIWDKIKSLPYIFQNYYFGLTPLKVRTICKIAQNKDIVFIDRSTFGIVAKVLKKAGYKGKIVTFFHNVEVVYYQVRIPKHALYRPLLLHCIDRNDSYAMQFSDITIGINPRDDNELFNRYGKKTDALIPVTFEDMHPKEAVIPIENPPTALFFGSYFPANVEGILWFIENVLPHVNIKLQIVGKGMDKLEVRGARYGVQGSSVQIFSDVEDVAPFIEGCDFVVSPIFKGSGMKVKTCETLMYGKTIIGTTESFEGYNIDFDKVGALANSKEEFIAAIEQIKEKFSNKFNAYSREYYLKNHTNEIAKKIFESCLF